MERVHLNPYEKFRRYRRVPWKLTIHVLLVLLTSLCVYLWTANDVMHIRHTYDHLQRVLIGESGKLVILNETELRDKIEESIENFFNLNNSKILN